MLFYAIPLFEHIRPCKLMRTDWTPPKTAKIIDSFRSPGDSPQGLAFDGEYLWVADSYGPGLIYKIDTQGNIIDYIGSPDYDPRGLAFDGTYLWLSDSGGWDFPGKIFKLDTSGNVIDSFSSPGTEPVGLTFDGEYLWCSDWEESKIYKLDTSGNVIDSIDAPGGSPADLTFDGKYLWSLSRITLLIYRLDTSGNVIESFYSPATYDPYNTFYFPSGLAWDGEYLRVAYAAEYDSMIYKYDVSSVPTLIKQSQLFTERVVINMDIFFRKSL
jgi:DNA-binding beta-propeller fold protein YncE